MQSTALGKYSPEHLIPLNQQQPPSYVQAWQRCVLLTLYTCFSSLSWLGEWGPAIWEEIVSGLRKEMYFPGNTGAHLYRRSLLNRDLGWEMHVHHLPAVQGCSSEFGWEGET